MKERRAKSKELKEKSPGRVSVSSLLFALCSLLYRDPQSVMANVGVIGLGAMGAPMARNLLKGGHVVTVFARRAEAMAPLVSAGATAAASPAEVASRSDVTITMVIDTRAVEEVALGPRGIIEGA